MRPTPVQAIDILELLLSFPFSVSTCFFKEARWFCTLSVFHCVRIWIKNDRTIKMSDLWCHRKLSGCEKNTLRHNGSDRKARAHFPHVPNRIKGIEAVAHQGWLQVVWFWPKADFISPDFAFMCEGLVLPSFPPSFPRDLPDLPDPAARWWIATRMASWWWKRSNRVLFRAPTATASSTRPSRCPPPKPSRTARICQDSRGRMLLACSNMLVTWVDWIWLRSVAKDQHSKTPLRSGEILGLDFDL